MFTLGSISSFCTFKINHGGSFTNTVSGKSYIDGLVDHFDFLDMDVFSVHKLDDMMAVLRYNDGGIMFYHFMILETDFDSGLLPLGTDQEVIQLARYVLNHKEINLYIELGNNRVVPCFKSPLKVRIEEVEGNHSPEINRLIERVIPLGGVQFEDNHGKKDVDTGDEHQPKRDVDPVDDYEVMGDVDAEYGGGKIYMMLSCLRMNTVEIRKVLVSVLGVRVVGVRII
ncbi:unnamed protein product [Lactuca saligna]|uniref:PB1-like domain-containing protein n=1 Tax=Lactuca saligna TaxID=75948 RepID=A0AA35VPH9_LACSI|nr:unnamed protein product [Lactuca saligna]